MPLESTGTWEDIVVDTADKLADCQSLAEKYIATGIH